MAYKRHVIYNATYTHTQTHTQNAHRGTLSYTQYKSKAHQKLHKSKEKTVSTFIMCTHIRYTVITHRTYTTRIAIDIIRVIYIKTK